MTDLKPNETIPETTTVELDQEKQIARVQSPKHKTDYIVSKLRSQMYFTVRVTVGSPPKELSGKYSSLEKAVDAVRQYVKNSKESFAVRSERLHEERQQRKHAESKPKTS